MMKKVHNVTFPRSGHRMLNRVLKPYLKGKMVYYEIYMPKPKNIDAVNYIKDHDFDLMLVPPKDRVYLVQIRFPLDCIISYFLLENKNVLFTQECKNKWQDFAMTKLNYWIKFYKKWVIGPMNVKRYILNYDDFILDPYRKSEEIIKFVGEEVNPDFLKDCIKNAGIKKKRNIKDFILYDNSFLNTMRLKIKDLPGVDVRKGRLIIPSIPSN